MLKLLSITLSRSSTLLSGDGYSILPEVLERLLPLLARTDLAQLHREATDVICKILALLHTTAPGLLAALVQGTHTLFEGGAPLACGDGGVARVSLLCCCHGMAAHKCAYC